MAVACPKCGAKLSIPKTEAGKRVRCPKCRAKLHLVAEGFTNAEIATKLYISPRTVETHRANMIQKLGLENQTQLVHYAVQQELIPPNN